MSFQVVEHSLVRDRLARLRHCETEPEAFRRAVHQLAQLVAAEAMRDLEMREEERQTPLAATRVEVLARPVVLVPILRAGLGMLQGVLELVPEAQVGHIGLYRNEETHRPESYYAKLPAGLGEGEVFLLDPMLATGNSAVAAVDQLKAAGARRIRFLSVIAAPEGVRCFAAKHPDVAVYTAALDEGLTSAAYITPGLGDAGDRYFGTL